MLLRAFVLLSTVALIAAQSPGPAFNLSSILSQQNELTSFTSYLNQFPELLAQVEPGNFTILAPSNQAFAEFLNLTNATSIDASKLEAILSYHALNGALTRAQFNQSPQFISTLLTNPRYANVTGGQRVEAISSGGSVIFYSAVKAISNLVTADIIYSGEETGVIHIIDNLLIPPLDEPSTVTEAKLNGFIEILVQTPPSPQILGVTGPSPDWTIFAPNSTTFNLNNVPESAIYAYEDYHFVQGEVAYTPDLTSGKKLKTVQGNDVTITVLNGSIYVNNQRIISPNYLISTGVLHLIESNLNPNDTSARPDLNSTSPPSFSSPPSSSTSSLSTGAKVGIGIGVVVGALGLLSLVGFYVRRRQRATSLQQPRRYDESGSAPPHELDPKSKGLRHEKDGRQVEEPPVELEGQHTF